MLEFGRSEDALLFECLDELLEVGVVQVDTVARGINFIADLH